MNMLWPIIAQAARSPGRTAVIDDQGRFSYARLLLGAMLVAENVESMTACAHVGILLPTGGLFPMSLLGLWMARRAAVPLNYLLRPQELGHVIDDSGIDTVVTVGPMLDFVRQAADGQDPLPDRLQLLQLDQMDRSGWPPLRWPPVPRDEDLAAILYTSGTSGRPKGVMLSHANLSSNVDAAIVHARITRADTFLGVLPQFHSFGLTPLTLIPLRVGARVIYSARFVPRRIIDLIRRYRPDIFMAVPSMYGALLSVKDVGPDDLAGVRMPISGGEPLPEATRTAFLERFNLRILEGYGLTETAPATNWCTPDRWRTHSVGTALPGVEVRIVDDEDRTLPPDQDGEVLIAGPNVMQGYYRRPQETAAAFVNLPSTSDPHAPARRFFRTGDIGRLDGDGYLYITGRKKEMLIIAGENVFPREIEEVLNKDESVADSAVIGRSDGVRGEVPIAFVELVEGADFDAAAMRSRCRERLAGYKVPREIHRVDRLPRSPTGKILRRDLT